MSRCPNRISLPKEPGSSAFLWSHLFTGQAGACLDDYGNPYLCIFQVLAAERDLLGGHFNLKHKTLGFLSNLSNLGSTCRRDLLSLWSVTSTLKHRRVVLAWLTLSIIAVSFGCLLSQPTESVCDRRRDNLSIRSGDLFSVKGLKLMVHSKQRSIKRSARRSVNYSWILGNGARLECL